MATVPRREELLRYLNSRSGIGGFEAAVAPAQLCGGAPDGKRIRLEHRPTVGIRLDVDTLLSPAFDVVSGWCPCKDLTVVGEEPLGAWVGADRCFSSILESLSAVPLVAGAAG
jgi:hypothetical protein